jgi:hypothetical protein
VCSTFRYFLQQEFKIYEWQFDSLLVLCVACFYGVEVPKTDETIPQAIHFAAVFQSLLGDVDLANQICGFPLGDFNVSHFFDGHTWMALYDHALSHKCSPAQQFLESTHLQTFTNLKKEILRGLDPKKAFQTYTKHKPNNTKTKKPIPVVKSPTNMFSLLQSTIDE